MKTLVLFLPFLYSPAFPCPPLPSPLLSSLLSRENDYNLPVGYMPVTTNNFLVAQDFMIHRFGAQFLGYTLYQQAELTFIQPRKKRNTGINCQGLSSPALGLHLDAFSLDVGHAKRPTLYE